MDQRVDRLELPLFLLQLLVAHEKNFGHEHNIAVFVVDSFSSLLHQRKTQRVDPSNS